MLEIYEQVAARCERGERVALCTMIGARGSTPQVKGAKMLVLGSGQIIGTLGGGCVEAEVRTRALEQISANRTEVLTFKLDHDYGWDDGLICGGTMEILVQVLETAEGARPFAAVAAALREGRGTELRLGYRIEAGAAEYVETVLPTPTLLIVGGGHVGRALAKVAGDLDFWVHVMDDRPEFASEERFPTARRRIVGDIEAELGGYAINEATYIVIVTRGHRHDGKALGAVVRSRARYVGLIGSRRKVITIMKDLEAAGVPGELLERVHAPIGLDIGGQTVPEIAVSIAAELVAVRRGKEGQAAGSLWMKGRGK
jgi:xanthine dehydrogenase accessory factor